jgi:signal transduction histidine kinase
LNSINELEKRLEDKIEQIKKLEKVAKMQEEFFSYMAHEFKTPLTITYSAIQLLDYLCKDELSDRAKGFINKIRQSTLQQLRLVNNIMDISRADSGYLKLNRKNYDIVLLTKVIVNSVTSITKGKGINIMFTSSVPSKYIFIDDEKYERILLNILSNAIKFTQAGKSIYVDLYVDDKVNIKVKDEGIGIPKDKGEIIFDRFGQINNGLIKNTEGTGIGLCLTKILANALGGDITFESEEGHGSEFTVQLPIISVANPIKDKMVNESIEDRLIQSINLEFSNIYL